MIFGTSRRWLCSKMCAVVLCAATLPALHGLQGLPSRSQDEYNQAESLVRAGHWDESLAHLLPLTALYPQNPRLLNLTGLALTGKGETQSANEYFLRCLQAAPGFFAALKNLGINEFHLHLNSNAEQHLASALLQAPHDRVLHLYLGQLAFERDDFRQAVQMLAFAGDLVFQDANVTAQLVASQLESGDSASGLAALDRIPPEKLIDRMQFALGLALLRAGNAVASIRYLQTVEQKHPHVEAINFDLAVAAVQAKVWPQAITAVRQLIADGHETSEIQNLLAEALEGNKQTQAAVTALRRAIALDPKDQQNYLDFASLCLNHQDYQDALKVLDVGLQMDPHSDRLVFERGILHALQDHFDLAEKDFELASNMAPGNALGTLGLGVSYLETGNSKEAVTLLRRQLLVTPGDPQLLYLLGEALLRSGPLPGDAAYNEAQKSLEDAIAGNPRLGLAHVSLGRIYLAENRNAEAVQQLELARDLNPNERAAYSHLATVYRRLGETEKAREALNALRNINDRDREAVTIQMNEQHPLQEGSNGKLQQ